MKVQPHAEHQQDHADLGQLLGQVHVADEARRVRADDHAGQQIADDGRKLELLGDQPQHPGRGERRGDGRDERKIVHKRTLAAGGQTCDRHNARPLESAAIDRNAMRDHFGVRWQSRRFHSAQGVFEADGADRQALSRPTALMYPRRRYKGSACRRCVVPHGRACFPKRRGSMAPFVLLPQQSVQFLDQFAQRLAAVADGVLAVGGQLGRRAVFALDEEQRVVAEAVLAVRLVEDSAFDRAVGFEEDHRRGAGLRTRGRGGLRGRRPRALGPAGQCEVADEPRRSLRIRHEREVAEQLAVVGGVDDFSAGGGRHFVRRVAALTPRLMSPSPSGGESCTSATSMVMITARGRYSERKTGV